MNGKRNAALIFTILCLSYFQTLGQNYVPGEVLIKMKPGKSIVQKNTIKHQMNANIKKTFSRSPLELWQISASQTNIETIIQQYKNHPDIEYIEPNYIYTLEDIIPNDLYFDKQWGLDNLANSNYDINAPAAWTSATGSPAVKVGVIDTGIDWKHEDLVDNIWQNLAEDADGDGHVIEWNGDEWIMDPGDLDGEDNDGNGYIDDLIGWDFVNDDNDPTDYHSHGTHVAGIIGARGNNNIGIAGVTWNVQLAALKAFGDNGQASISDIQEAIEYSVMMGIPITNNSWGSITYSFTLDEAIKGTASNGYLFIASAGNGYGDDNDEYPYYPSSYDFNNIISVASIDRNGTLSSFSNFGATDVDIAAPGSDIPSTIPNNQYNYKSGTSMAAPHVTGACALLWELHSDKDATQIREAVLGSASVTEYTQEKVNSNGQLDIQASMGYFDTSPTGCGANDLFALTALYYAMDGPNWTNSWDLESPIEEWHGITLDETGCVVAINLSSNGLNGYIPREIGYLPHLTELYLGNNQLVGYIPKGLFDLTELEVLYLAYNQLTGNIPNTIGNLSNLRSLNLAFNQLEGTIPDEIYNLSQLTSINLGLNQLTGIISPEIGNLQNLEGLVLCFNQITGMIPAELGNLENLTTLNLSSTYLFGCYPESLTNLCGQITNGNVISTTGLDAQWADFCNENLRAGICSYYGIHRSTDSLALLALYNATQGQNWSNPWNLNLKMEEWEGVILNEFGRVAELNLTGRNLNGNIPTEIGDLRNLQVLSLDNNSLNGIIPDEIGAMTYMNHISIKDNKLTGTIPVSIQTLTNLTHIDIENNLIAGDLPIELGNLTKLEYLNLARNNLSSKIPPELSNLHNLEVLHLFKNMLAGEIPGELGDLANLSVLTFANNQLSGCYHPNLSNLCEQLDYSESSVIQQNELNATWTDFCTFGNSGCPKPVWPGDMDGNGIVEKEDLLYWGLAAGNADEPRPDATTQWEAQDCPQWAASVNQVNGKHQDADGNGIVDENDIDVIRQNYSQSHSFSIDDITTSNAQYSLSAIGQPVPVQVVGGNNMYALTYELIAEPLGVGTLSVLGLSCSIDFGAAINNAEFEANTSLNSIQSIGVFNGLSRMDVAITKSGLIGQNITGARIVVGNLNIVVFDDFIDDDGPIALRVKDGSMMEANGNLSDVAGSTLYQNLSLSSALEISANVTHANCDYWGSINLTVSGGATPYDIQWNNGTTDTEQIFNLEPGLYTATIQDATGLTTSIEVEVEGQYIPGYDEDGNLLECNPIEVQVSDTGDDKKREGMGENSYLQQNYPNPFAETTIIPYDIPEDAKNPVLNIFDVTGNLKYTTPVHQMGEGEIQISQHKLPTGIYYYQLKMDERISATRKMIIVR